MRNPLRERKSLFSAFLYGSDAVLSVASGILAYLLRHGHLHLPKQYLIALVIGVLLSLTLFSGYQAHRVWEHRRLFDEIRRVLTAWSVVLLSLILIGFITKTSEDYSRIWVMLWWGIGAVLLCVNHLVGHWALSHYSKKYRKARGIILVGDYEIACKVYRSLAKQAFNVFDVKGLLSTQPSVVDADEIKWLGSCGALLEYLEKEPVDEVWLTYSLGHDNTIRDVMKMLQNKTVDVRYIPDLFGMHLLNRSVSEIAGMPVINIALSPMENLNRVIKAAEDYILGFFFLLLCAPLMMLIGLAVKLTSPGPALFKQQRLGWNGNEIEVWKFRSMHLHHEADGQVTQARKGDSRITWLGRWLRETSLDELPQFINVLQGRMSIVGPRPHALAHNDYYRQCVDGYMLRHKVKPGITGWAQVNGYRGETDTLEKMEKRVQYDLYYLEHWSLWLDLKIIVLTAFWGFIDRNT